MNVPAVLGLFRLWSNPTHWLPHHTVATFAELPVPLSPALALTSSESAEKQQPQTPDIRAVVLDKDNCFARAGDLSVYPAYEKKLASLLATYPRARLLIVSNSAGLASSDPGFAHAAALERATGIPVLRHADPKPSRSCAADVLAHFRAAAGAGDGKGVGGNGHASEGELRPSQIAVVGDRLFSDVALAHTMGAWAVWLRDGVVRDTGPVGVFERFWVAELTRRDYRAPTPER